MKFALLIPVGYITRGEFQSTAAIAEMARALEAEPDIAAALQRYQAERKPIVQKLVTAARTSADWYEHFPEQMKLDLMDFGYSYITRSGRIDDARLRAMSPAFMARYEASKNIGSGS